MLDNQVLQFLSLELFMFPESTAVTTPSWMTEASWVGSSWVGSSWDGSSWEGSSWEGSFQHLIVKLFFLMSNLIIRSDGSWY